MKIALAIALILHGLITAAQAGGSFSPTGGIANPAFLKWWPAGLGQSWLWAGLGVEKVLAVRAGGVLWLAAGACLVAAGLALLGVIVPVEWWRGLALAGAGLSLGMLALYLHPFYAIGIAASAALLIAFWAEKSELLARLGM